MFWSHCLLCCSSSTTSLGVEEEDLVHSWTQFSRIEGSERNDSDGLISPKRLDVLLKYLLDKSKPECGTLTKNLVKFLCNHLAREERNSEEIVQARLCSGCLKIVEDVMKLHEQLEEIQSLIAMKMKGLKEAVVSNSRLYGTNMKTKERFQRFEKWIDGQEDKSDGIGAGRKFLEFVHDFQTHIFESDDRPITTVEVSRDITTPEEADSYVKVEVIEQEFPFEHYDAGEDDFSSFPNLESESSAACHSSKNAVKRGRPQKKRPAKKQCKKTSNEPTVVPPSRTRSARNAASVAVAKIQESVKKPACNKPNAPKSFETSAAILLRRSLLREETAEMKTKRKPRVRSRYSHPKNKKRATKHSGYDYSKLACEVCGFSCSNRPSQMVEHLRKEHETDDKPDECPDCRIRFGLRQLFLFHLDTHVYTKKCEDCNEKIVQVEMRSHIENKHGGKCHSCNNCEQVFSSFTSLVSHCRLHSGVSLECELCSESDENPVKYSSMTTLLKHLSQVHSVTGSDLPCTFPECYEVFYSKNALWVHVNKKHKTTKTKTAPEKFSCKFCPRTYSKRILLENHIGVDHLGERNFECSLCHEKLKSKGCLKSHQRKEHPHLFPQFVCGSCSSSFLTPEGLQKHQKMNHPTLDDKVFPCPLCGKVFRVASRLRIHSEVHNDEKSLKCDQCGFATKTREMLKRHVLKHHTNREFKYLCPDCGKGFYELAVMRTHRRKHTGEKPFICDICGTRVSQKSSLNLHMQKVHKMKSARERQLEAASRIVSGPEVAEQAPELNSLEGTAMLEPQSETGDTGGVVA